MFASPSSGLRKHFGQYFFLAASSVVTNMGAVLNEPPPAACLNDALPTRPLFVATASVCIRSEQSLGSQSLQDLTTAETE